MSDEPQNEAPQPKKKTPRQRVMDDGWFTILPKSRRARIRVALVLLGFFSLIGLGGCLTISMPGSSHKGPLPALSYEEQVLSRRLKEHVTILAEEIGARNHSVQGQLDAAVAYISSTLTNLRFEVAVQDWEVGANKAKNLEVEIKGQTKPEEIIVVGGHYDSVRGCPGANDNASGTAAVLEMARLFKDKKLARTVRFVAFADEEPPYFWTANMGSLKYARRCRERQENIVGMLSMETLGCYSDQEGSQQYPFPFNLFYPSTGNFVGFVGNPSSRSFTRRCIGSFRGHTDFPSEGVAAPGNIPGIGWSDHWSFWQVDYPAVMITDTATFRYREYHTSFDTPDKLDYDRMARVVAGVTRVVVELAEPLEK